MENPNTDSGNLNPEDQNDNTLITETGESFRDRSSHIDSRGKRVWIFPTKPKGRFHRARLIVGYVFLAIFFILPVVKYNDQQFVLIDILSRKFIIFGTIWWPHDFFIVAIGIIICFIFIVFFTAVFGRIWCGWACPQTIFMELVFRKIEYFIEGDGPKQRALKKKKFTGGWWLKKLGKHTLFQITSLIVNTFFVSYIISFDTVVDMMFISPCEHTGGWLFLSILTGLFYLNYSWFREQACTFVCPYGRLQSVLLDDNSVVVAYDYKRGEKRAKLKDFDDSDENGDCIDCGACVRVCPTGIDIRNGIQLECVNCTHCIDSCDEIMDKVKRPRGLIRYASINQIEQGAKFKFTPRIQLYIVLLTALLTVFVVMLSLRTDVEANILRARGSTYTVNENGNVVNIFTFKIINKKPEARDIELKTIGIEGKFTLIGTEKLELKAEEILEGTFLLEIPESALSGKKNEIEIGVYSKGELITSIETNFSGPKKK